MTTHDRRSGSSVRPRLAKGDDGSANIYPSRLIGSPHPDFEFVDGGEKWSSIEDYDRQRDDEMTDMAERALEHESMDDRYGNYGPATDPRS